MKKTALGAILLFAITGVIFLITGLEERVIDGGPIHYVWISLAVTFFAIAFGVFRQSRRER
jgi:hypothetical protein